jgi:FkbM family methyltransferase
VVIADLYDQDTEVKLAYRLFGRLSNRVVIDVGAEKGAFTRVVLDHGADKIFAIEPHPDNARRLRDRFSHEPSVTVLEMAVGAENTTSTLYVVEDKSGQHPDSFHTLVTFDETAMLKQKGKIQVRCRTLDSLIVEGVIPQRIGFLKIDTERGDLDVIRGANHLVSDVVMVEFWDDLSETVGPSTYRLCDLEHHLKERGFSNFAAIKRFAEFEVIQLNNSETRAGEWGNAIFIHDSVWAEVSPLIFAAMATAQTQLIDKAVMFAHEAHNRIEVIDEQTGRIEQLERHLDERPEPETEPADEPQSEQQRTVFADQNLASVARGAVLEEQEQALETYLNLRREEGMWRWLQPRLGVLRQYEPIALQIPPHYMSLPALAAWPRISVVTPSLNHGEFIERTILSVLDQRYESLQYVIQDGGSTDKTLDILGRYAPRLAHVDSDIDSGIGEALNRGFAHTTGEIMAYLNSDDVLLPGTLHTVAAYFAAHPEVDAVYGHRVLLDADDNEIGRWVLPPHDDEVLRWVDYIPQETLFWRRRAWDLTGQQIDETFKFAVDWELLLRLAAAGATFARVPRFLGAFRVHDAQKTSSLLEDVGAREMSRLRLRSMTRAVTAEEVDRAVQAYLRRHVVYHKLYRLGVLRY